MKIVCVDFTANISNKEFAYEDELIDELSTLNNITVTGHKPNIDLGEMLKLGNDVSVDVSKFPSIFLAYIDKIQNDVQEADCVILFCHTNSAGSFDLFSLEKLAQEYCGGTLNVFAEAMLLLQNLPVLYNKNIILFCCEFGSSSSLGCSFDFKLSDDTQVAQGYRLQNDEEIKFKNSAQDILFIKKFIAKLLESGDPKVAESYAKQEMILNSSIKSWRLEIPSEIFEFSTI